jgi:predicted HTH transcriptional regulator
MSKEQIANIRFDQTICLGLDVTDDDITKLCSSMKQTALKNCRNDEERATVKDVTVNQLISWGIVLERDGKYVATNAFALLTGNDILPTATQCGMFKGTTKANFIDRREYTGPIQDQVEEALQFVLRNIHMGAEFSGLSRQDVYEIPVESIRELLLNAVIHRSYLNHSNIQVAIYDDRLEVTSPGKLPMGQNIKRMKEGYSIIRNEAIAYAFSYMKLMEHWGSGIPRIIERVVAAGLREPEFIDGDIDLRINIYRRQNGDNVTKNVTNVTKNVTIDTNEAKIIELITNNPSITQTKLAKELDVTTRTVKRILSKLQADGIVLREGTNRSGRWILVEKQEQ